MLQPTFTCAWCGTTFGCDPEHEHSDDGPICGPCWWTWVQSHLD